MRSSLLLTYLGISLLCGCASTPLVPPEPALPTTVQAGDATVVAIAPAKSGCCCSLPKFLGIPEAVAGIRGIGTRIRSRLGYRFPGLEPQPALLPITDPANMSEDASPAVKAAAETKQEEDKAMQKAKAVRYLASVGCGECYPDTEQALIDALDDCIELVRYEAAAGLRKRAGYACKSCRRNSCCTPKLLEKLRELAYETDANGCCVEPSARVRRMARLTLRGCGGADTSPEPELAPQEGPTAAETPEPTGEPAPADASEEATMSAGSTDVKNRQPWSTPTTAATRLSRMPPGPL